MTVKEVRRRVKVIETVREDDEAAHGREDRLYVAVLNAIANGAKNGQGLALEALKARDIDFARWCA